VLQARLAPQAAARPTAFGRDFEGVFAARIAEADAFFAARAPADARAERRNITRQAYAGLLWSKQFYHYVVPNGSPAIRRNRRRPRNVVTVATRTGRTSTTAT
jgi:hypothetical protein